jgi:TonB family protein
MKALFSLIAFFTISSIVFGQTEKKDSSLNNIFVGDSTTIPCDCFEYECDVTEPMFPGGEKELYHYVKVNSGYTPEMLDLDLSGTVYVQFVIETDGSISHVEVLKGLQAVYDQKAIEIISNMPKWIPGKDECGKLVRVRYILPLRFDIN